MKFKIIKRSNIPSSIAQDKVVLVDKKESTKRGGIVAVRGQGGGKIKTNPDYDFLLKRDVENRIQTHNEVPINLLKQGGTGHNGGYITGGPGTSDYYVKDADGTWRAGVDQRLDVATPVGNAVMDDLDNAPYFQHYFHKAIHPQWVRDYIYEYFVKMRRGHTGSEYHFREYFTDTSVSPSAYAARYGFSWLVARINADANPIGVISTYLGEDFYPILKVGNVLNASGPSIAYNYWLRVMSGKALVWACSIDGETDDLSTPVTRRTVVPDDGPVLVTTFLTSEDGLLPRPTVKALPSSVVDISLPHATLGRWISHPNFHSKPLKIF